jgi:hypothetical protein
MGRTKVFACPLVPKEMIVPLTTLEAFMQGRSMADRPFIVFRGAE